LVQRAMGRHPNAEILAHPECKPDVLALADYIGSTSGIIEHATRSECNEFIVCTEMGILYELESKNPDKVFHLVQGGQVCTQMKKITLEKILEVLEDGRNNVFVESDTAEKAIVSLNRMLELVK
ncbi:MAG: quinolinate synthase NadA, partial [Actinobacteria bacterium]|nr:quinolinate synthase NadA [Actinomycetota bacterium]